MPEILRGDLVKIPATGNDDSWLVLDVGAGGRASEEQSEPLARRRWWRPRYRVQHTGSGKELSVARAMLSPVGPVASDSLPEPPAD